MSFSFGSVASAPAGGGIGGGFSFGVKPSTPGFGLSTTTQASTGLFGSTAVSTPAFGGGTFGSTTTPALGTGTPAFGTGTTFGTATTSTPSFGSNTSGFGTLGGTPSFGTSSAPAFGTSTSGLGTTTTSTFGSTPAFSTSGFGNTGLNFGSTTTTPFNANKTKAGTLGSWTTTTASSGLGGLGGFGTTNTTQNTGLSLFGGATTATSSLFGGNSATTNVTGAQLPTTATQGLGGLQQTGIGTGTTTGNTNSETPKQTKLPNEILTSVESFKEFVKKQKSLSSEVTRVSVKPLHKVYCEAEALLRKTASALSEGARARAHSRRLRASAAAALGAAEAVTRDLSGAELEGLAPPEYFKELVSELEQQLMNFKKQMDVAEKQMQSTQRLLSEQEITLGIKRMHESLVALAGRLQTVHSQVQAQKEQYLNLRKYILKDPTNVFEQGSSTTGLDQILRDAEGMKRKTKSSTFAEASFSSAVMSDPKTALGVQNLAGPTPFIYLGSNLSSFPAVDATGSNWQPSAHSNISNSLNFTGLASNTDATTNLQLQKPPGKRGKH